MSNHDTIRLTAAEVSSLWSQYQADTMVSCVFTHFLNTIQDSEIRSIIEYAMQESQKHILTIKEIFVKDDYPVPFGFSPSEDVVTTAHRMFTDVFMLMYLRQMSILGMAGAGLTIGTAARSDVSILFMEVIAGAVKLHDRARQLLLKKGLYVRPPSISAPLKAEYIQNQSFLSGFFGEKRALTAMEITHLVQNIKTNEMGKAMSISFAQCARNDDTKNFLWRAKQIAEKHIGIFTTTLNEEDVPVPMSSDSCVTDSTAAPFSDKLMISHVCMMNAAGIGNYAVSAAASQRRDLALSYGRLMAEIGLLAEDGVQIMIDNNWLEQPPMAEDRAVLVGKH